MEKKQISRVEKTLKKFKKRICREEEKNAQSPDFNFAAKCAVYWYFKVNIESGDYSGQTHIVEFKLIYGNGDNTYVYPVSAPKCSFITPIWHPNISDRGTICLDVLKHNWTPAMNTSNVVSCILLLLNNPEPSSPQNKLAAKTFLSGPETHLKKIKDFYNKKPTQLHIKTMKLFD